MKFTIRKIGNGWILKMICYGKSALKEPYAEFRDELFFISLDQAVLWLKKEHNVDA